MFGNLDHIEVREAGGSLIVRKKLVFRQSLFYNILVDVWWVYGLNTDRQTDRTGEQRESGMYGVERMDRGDFQ